MGSSHRMLQHSEGVVLKVFVSEDVIVIIGCLHTVESPRTDERIVKE